MNNLIGQQLGKYDLVDLLGEGGFAKVYLAEHIYLNTKVAVKVLNMHLMDDDLELFHTEARTVAHLVHPHIVRVLDFGVERGIPYLVMDYAPHGSLKDRHPRGVQLPLSTVVLYVKQIADALQYAHDQKLIHRDIKPANMLVGARNEILLSDFGTAIIAHSTRSQKTQNVIGTVDYMAPEQMQGHPSQASDQYALGVVVYKWLTGDLPFDGTTSEVAVKHLTVPPPPLHTRTPSIPALVEQVVLRVLAKNPQQRFASVQGFASALEQASLSAQPSSLTLSSNTSTLLPTPAAQQSRLSEPDTLSKTVGAKLMSHEHESKATHHVQGDATIGLMATHNPNYENGVLAPQGQELREEPLSLRIQHLEKQAREARQAGAWQQEIDAWTALSQQIQEQHQVDGRPRPREIDDQLAKARARISIATCNLQYEWMYKNAQQLVKDGNRETAKTVLKELWRNAPDYGDPVGLAKEVDVRVPLRKETLQRLKAYWVSAVLLVALISDPFLYFWGSNWPYAPLAILILTAAATLSILPFFFEKGS